MSHIQSVKISDGLGFGTGAIGRAGVPDEALRQAEAVIQSDIIVVPLGVHQGRPIQDDGCGDGRPVARVFTGTKECPVSLDRAKVFGGGATMAVAMLIGTEQAAGKSLDALYVDAMDLLTGKNLTFGGHTDDQAAGGGSGCGAIDKSPAIIAAAGVYQDQITTTLQTLQVASDGLDEIFAAFAAYAAAQNFAHYNGRDIIGTMLSRDKVVKELRGVHREKYIVLNTIPGMTVNQAAVRDATNGEVQIFGVDLWRIEVLAQAFEDDNAQRARLAALVYTLATAAVLTAGDLPVYIITNRA